MKKILFLLLIVSLSCEETCGGGKSGQPDATTITVASWNLKNFGQTKLNDPARIDVIVDVLKGYDITAIQEVQDISLGLAPALIQKMNADGANFNYVISDRLGYTTQEQYLYVYDDDKIDPVSNTGGYGFEPNDEFSREPFYQMFRAGNFDFYLMTIHTSPTNVNISIPALDTTYEHLQYGGSGGENDIILLGDFNAKAPGTTASSYATMTDLATIPNMTFLINTDTNTRGGRAYDNILFQSSHTTEYSGEAGVYTFWTDYGLTEDQGYAISDHKPVWASFTTSGSDDD